MTDKLEALRNKISQVKSKPIHNEDCGDVRRIYNYCVHLLARQDYSEHKLRQKLRSKPQNLPHHIDEAILKIKEKGLLREEGYRRLFIRKWMIKGESEDKIRKRGGLENLKFQDDEFKVCAEELGFKDEDSLQKLLAKKLRSKIIPKDLGERSKLKDKVLRFLISKGHGFEEAKRAISHHFNHHSSNSNE
jgi:SOS response regulatory protein OraA/RecX